MQYMGGPDSFTVIVDEHIFMIDVSLGGTFSLLNIASGDLHRAAHVDKTLSLVWRTMNLYNKDTCAGLHMRDFIYKVLETRIVTPNDGQHVHDHS